MWYLCAHGNTRTYSPSSNWSKHTEHTGSPLKCNTKSTSSAFSRGYGPSNFVFERGHFFVWFSRTSAVSSFTVLFSRDLFVSTFSKGNAPMILAESAPSFESGPLSSSSFLDVVVARPPRLVLLVCTPKNFHCWCFASRDGKERRVS